EFSEELIREEKGDRCDPEEAKKEFTHSEEVIETTKSDMGVIWGMTRRNCPVKDERVEGHLELKKEIKAPVEEKRKATDDVGEEIRSTRCQRSGEKVPIESEGEIVISKSQIRGGTTWEKKGKGIDVEKAQAMSQPKLYREETQMMERCEEW